MAAMDKVYARTIIRRAKKEIADQPQNVLILSPYLTSQTAETVISEAEPSSTDVYTTFKSETFASGGSSISTVRLLLELGYNLYELTHLHAKTILTSEFGLVGSQNLTKGGTKNREISVVLTDKEELDYLRSEIEEWGKDRRSISLAMVKDMENLLPELKRAYKKFENLTTLSDQKIDEAIVERELERQRREKERQHQEVARKKDISQKRKTLIRKRSDPIRKAVKSGSVISSTVLQARIEPKPKYDLWGNETFYDTLVRRRTDVSFLRWVLPSGSDEFEMKMLTKRDRYLLLLLENGRLSWPALNQTQISQYGISLNRTSPIPIGDYQCLLDFDFASEDDDLQKWNVKTRIFPVAYDGKKSGVAMTVYGYFSIDALEVVDWSIDDGAADSAPQIENLIAEARNKVGIEKAIIHSLLSPFKYTHNRLGVGPRSFFRGQGEEFDFRLRKLGRHYFLTAEKT